MPNDDELDTIDVSERFRASGEARNMVADDIDYGDSDDDLRDEDSDDEDSDDEDEDDEDDDDDEDLVEAGEDELDLAVGVYREDGVVMVQALGLDVANDLDELIAQLRRMPGDSGSIGMVSLDGDLFVLTRVRGSRVQVLLSDAAAALDWPLARDVADFLGVEELPDPDEDETEPLGDLDLLQDQGLSAFELTRLCEDLDDSDQAVLDVADRIHVGPQVRRVVRASFD